MRQLYINGNEIELTESEPIAFTFQVNDIGELEDRFANFSNTFRVPRTQNNSRSLYFSDQINSSTNAPYRKLPARYIEDGVDIVGHEGFAIIKSSADFFEIVLFSGIFDLFDAIGDSTFKDLDWSDLNHDYEISTIIALNAADGDIVWPLIDWGVYTKGQPVDVRYQRPAIKFSYIVDKIFDTFGFSYSGNVLNEYRYKNLAMTVNTDQLVLEDAVKTANSAKMIARDSVAPIAISGLRGERTIDFLAWMRYPTDQFGNQQAGSFIGDNIVFTTAYLPTFNVTVNAIQAVVNQTINFSIHLWVYGYMGVALYKNGRVVGSGILQTSGSVYEPLEFTVSGLNVKAGDIFYVLGGNNPLLGQSGNAFQNNNGDYSYQYFECINADEYLVEVNYNSIIPEIPIKDFLRNFANIFGLFYTVTGKNQIEFTMMKDVLSDFANAEDWSSKLDLSEEPNISFQIPGYAQKNFLTWEPQEFDNAISNSGLGDGQLIIDDQTIEKEKSLINLLFSASIPYYNIADTSDMPTGGNTGLKIPRYVLFSADDYAPYKEYSENDIVKFGNQIWIVTDPGGVETEEYPGTSPKWELYQFQYEQTITTNVRLVLLRPLSSENVTQINYTDGTTTTLIYASAIPLAYFFDNSFDSDFQLGWNNLLAGYYSEFMRMLDRSKVVDCLIRLNNVDINKLDFSRLKYIGHFNNYFFLNKVGEYIDGRSAKCQLVRI